jgi:SAM-dependent methyltransferase
VPRKRREKLPLPPASRRAGAVVEPAATMSDPQKAALPLHPATTLVPWLEDLVQGRRIAVLGDTTIGLVESLADRGARLVHGYDPDAARAVEAAARSGRIAAPRPVFAALSDDLGIRDGAFDVVVVPDLAALADASEAIRRIRRMLSPTGVAIIASRNPDAPRWLVRAGAVVQSGPSYYDLYDLVSLQFPEVKMLGQAPFVGYAIVDFAADEPEVTVDATLLDEPEAPEWYVVVASDRRLEVESYALVELPLAEVAAGLAGGEPTTLRRHELEGSRALLEARGRELELELLRVRESFEAATLAARDRDAIATRLADSERELIAAVGRMREAEARAADTHVRAERLSTELREIDDELRRQRERALRLNKLLEDERKARPRGAGGTLVTDKPLVSENAAVTIRPEALDETTRHKRADLPPLAAPVAPQPRPDLVELERLRARVAELEEERRETPPPTIEPVTIEPATLDRERIKQRLVDAEERARRAEARANEREAHAAEATRKLVTALEQREAVEARLAAAEPELAQLRANALSGESELRSALARAEARASQLERALTEGARKVEAAEKRAEVEAVRAAAVSEARDAALAEARDATAKLRNVDEGAAERAHQEEIDRLESALRDRGREISKLRAELREGLRVGKELLQELEAARVIAPFGRGSTGGGGLGSREPSSAAPTSPGGAELANAESGSSAEAERAARDHADLVGKSLKIAQLENEVRRLRVPQPPDALVRELERALVLAQEEIADLRVQAASVAASGSAVVEQQVLLAQLDALASASGPSFGPSGATTG